MPAPFARQRLTEDMLTTRTPEAHAWAVKISHISQRRTVCYPFAVGKQTVIFPGFDGGGEWGGAAIDPATDILYVGSSEMAWTGGLTRAGRRQSGRGYIRASAPCAMASTAPERLRRSHPWLEFSIDLPRNKLLTM